jgi:hypothetical protein
MGENDWKGHSLSKSIIDAQRWYDKIRNRHEILHRYTSEYSYYMGKKLLRKVPPEKFYKSVPSLSSENFQKEIMGG